jgi:hypothetical protein
MRAVGFLLLLGCAIAPPQDPVERPEEFFGHPVGQDRTLFFYSNLVEYLRALEARSPKLQIVKLGETTLGREFVMAVVSDPANLKEAKRYREISAALARGEGNPNELAARGKAIVLFTMGLHSTEIMSSQTAAEMIHRLVTGREEADWLKEVILLVIPSMNPDGQEMIVEWYRKHLGTEYEGGPMPWLYHPYAGHDNNRDWFMFNLKESGPVADVMYRDWTPQVIVDFHQMGATGARYFIPPYKDPPNPYVHPLVWREISTFCAHIAQDFEEAGKRGVLAGETFESWFPSAAAKAPWWHNQVAILFEGASCRIATPVRVERNETDTRQRQNLTHPWEGGWWHPRDIVDYQMVSGLSVVRTAAKMRETLLRNLHLKAVDQMQRARREGPFAWAIPAGRGDASAQKRMVEALQKGGVDVRRLRTAARAGDREIPAGSAVIFAEQPNYGYIRVLLEPPDYPAWAPAPYDVTGWALPWMMGVEVWRVEERFEGRAEEWSFEPERVEYEAGTWGADPACTDSARWANRCLAEGVELRRDSGGRLTATFDGAEPFERCRAGLALRLEPRAAAADAVPVRAPRIGVYKPWQASMDEGWLRYVLEGFEFKYRTIKPEEVAKTDLAAEFDVIVLPDVAMGTLVDGRAVREGERRDEKKQAETYPPEYRAGMEKDGVERLGEFVQKGGTLIALGRSTELPIEKFPIPVRNGLKGVARADFSCPGSLVAVEFGEDGLCAGMPRRGAGAFFAGQGAFETSVPFGPTDRRVAARFGAEKLLRHGFLMGEEKIASKPALVDARWGKGRVVLFAFSPHYRGQAYGTFKLLFNAVWSHEHRECAKRG